LKIEEKIGGEQKGEVRKETGNRGKCKKQNKAEKGKNSAAQGDENRGEGEHKKRKSREKEKTKQREHRREREGIQRRKRERTGEKRVKKKRKKKRSNRGDYRGEQRTKRGETMVSLQRGRRRKTVAPPGFSATTTASCRDTNASTVNDSASIPGNTLLLLLLCPVGLLHAERVLLTFLQQGR
jgi:hypothetical protein